MVCLVVSNTSKETLTQVQFRVKHGGSIKTRMIAASIGPNATETMDFRSLIGSLGYKDGLPDYGPIRDHYAQMFCSGFDGAVDFQLTYPE